MATAFRLREDVADMIYVADVKEKPFIAMVKKGPAPKNLSLFEYGVKSRGARKHGGVPNRKDVNAFDTQIPPDWLQARSEVWRRAPQVGFIDVIESSRGAIAGVEDIWADAKADQLEEIGRDMETEFLSNQDSRADDGVNGLWTRGMGRWLHNPAATNGDTLTLSTESAALGQPTSGFAELAIPSAYRTPANQIYDGVIGDGVSTGLTEQVVKDLIGAKWGNTGASSELHGFVTQIIKDRFGFFADYEKNVAGATPMVQITSGRIDGNTLMGRTVDIYKSEWGTYILHPEPTSFMPTAYTGYLLDMKQVQIRRTTAVNEKDLPDLGGGPRELIQAIDALQGGDPRAHVKFNATAS
jgi:hypothetical protein